DYKLKGREGSSSIDNLFGVYALTSQGQFVFRTLSGANSKSAIIATYIIDQCSYVSPSGYTVVAAYGKNIVYLSAHRPEWEEMSSPRMLSISY
ncbi:hypothetical protein PFISCL1PPCAC_20807, partial [Pristionchus fissidentatus]